MLHWLKYPFLRFTPAFIVGITLAKTLDLKLYGTWMVLVILLTGFTVLLFFSRKHFFSLNPLIGLTALSIVVTVGSIRTISNTQIDQAGHFSNFKFTEYTGVINSWPEMSPERIKVTIEIIRINTDGGWREATGNVLIYLPPQDSAISYGTNLLINASPSRIRPPRNPGEFDYGRYLANRNIFHQQFLIKGEYLLTGNNPTNIFQNWGYRIRTAGKEYSEDFIGVDHRGVANALLLGIRDNVNDELRDAYAHAGAVHILAISGLHLGILYGFLIVIFGKFKKRLWFVIFSLLVLWGYAAIAGLSPSVTRAALMFSIISVGQFFYRTPNIFNTIAFSAFLLFLVNPFQLYDVGFQLSYLAVIGIVWLYPFINGMISSRFQLIERVWSLMSVTLAAQILTLPLVLYYFHNYPLLSFISNLIVVPLTTVILVSGLIFLITAGTGLLLIPKMLGRILDFLIGFMNDIVLFVERIPGSYVSDIHLPGINLILLYLFILGILVFLFLKNLDWLRLATLSWVAFIFLIVVNNISRNNQKEIVIYDLSGVCSIDYFNSANVTNYTDPYDDESIQKVLYATSSNRLTKTGYSYGKPMNIRNWKFSEIKFFLAGEDLFLIIDKAIDPGYNSQSRISVDYVVISQNAVRDFEYLSKLFLIKKVILDGSNDHYYTRWASNELERLRMDYHNIRKDGCLVIEMAPP